MSNIENIYNLAPLQSGMLFHVLYDSSNENPYVAQSLDEFVGPLDVSRMREAWQAVVDRHTIMRSAFVWEGLDQPLQVVQRRVELPFVELDWRGIEADEQERRLKRLLDEDRVRGFDLGTAPLLRVTTVRMADERYMVLWSFHHLLLDGWSTQMVQKEVFALYRAALEDKSVKLAEPIPYSRYIEWLAEQSKPAAERYWRRYLGTFEEPTELGIGRSTGETGFGDTEIELDADLSARLGEFARTHHVTVNTVVQGAWALLLSRYSGSDDVLYGATVSGRPTDLADAESMVGLFINTLPVRARVPADRPVDEFLHELQRQHVELRQYEYTSLVDAQGWSAVPKGEQLFNSILVFENYPKLTSDSGLPKNLMLKHRMGAARTGYPLTVAVSHTNDRLLAELTYDRSLFDRTAAQRMAEHFGALLSSLVSNPAARLGELEMIKETERRQLLVEWNDRKVGVVADATLHGLVERRAAEQPDSVAVVLGGTSLSYGELNERANRLAHRLQGLGVAPGALVGVCLERGLEMVVGLLAVLKAGGAYVPLDPEHPVKRLAFILEDTTAKVVVTQQALRDRLPADGVLTLSVDTDQESISRQSATNPVSGATPDDVAYVIYTSGSTGIPKGVQIEHRCVVHRLRSTDDDFAFGPEDVWTLFHSFAFDFSVWEIWGALTYGGRLVVVDRDTTRNAAAFMKLLIEQRVTVLNQTPSAFGLLQQEIGRKLAGHLALRLVVFGGEALQPTRLRPWWEAYGGAGPRLVNMYGITEATVHVTAREITSGDAERSAVSPIGRPLADTEVFVLDPAGGVVPVGVAGELWVGGAGLARGYLNRPELTAERFVECEIGGRVRRLYRSGDLVRWLSDGELEYLGRLDDQVKVRGFRIELGEIESALAGHPEVAACTILAREDVPGDRRLVAYVVLATGVQQTLASLREWCGQILPEHMIPRAFVELEELPLTTNGKADHKALPAPDGARPELGTEFVAPRTPVEETLAGIWAEVLGVEQVGVHDNFFGLGGDSILSIQVISRAKRYDLHLTPRMIFQHQTVAEIVRHEHQVMTQREKKKAETPAGSLPTEYRLAPMQSGILFHVLHDPSGQNPYLVQFPDEFVGPLDVSRLREAWQAVVDRHAVLRTAFVWEGLDEPLQEVKERVEVPFAELDWRGTAADEQERLLERLVSDDRAQGFELDAAPLLRLTVARLADERWIVLWSFHHMVLDGWSAQLVQKEVFAHYRASLGGSVPRLVDPVPYARYIAWLSEQSRPAAEKFWRRRLESFEAPTGLGIERTTGAIGYGDVEFELDDAQSARLRRFARAHRLTLNTVVQGAWSLLLSRYSGSEDVVYGNTASGRPASLPEAESMVGLFINTLPIRAWVPADRNVVEWLRELQDQHVELRQYEYSSLAEVQGWSAVPKREGLFKSILAFQNFPALGQDDLPQGLTRISCRNVERTGYPITAMVYNNDRLKVGVAYDLSMFDRKAIERMVQHFVVLLSSMADDPTARLGTVQMLTADESRQLLVEWNSPSGGVHDAATLHGLVEVHAQERPDAVAVVFGAESLSYRQLNERANRLAHHLRGLGVGPEVLVGVCLERGLEMVIALLAVLKAGGAYVPLDPEYPVERLKLLLEDTAAPVVLTQEVLRNRLPVDDRELICLDADSETIAQEAATDPVSDVGPDNLAYVIYTSGSTGTPKGVQIQHRSILNRFRGTDEDFGFGTEDVWPLFHSFAFDVSVWEIWGALTYGGRLVVVDRDTTRNAAAFMKLLIEQRVTVLNQTPSAFGLLQQVIGTESAGRLSLRLVIFAGEALQPTRLRPWWEAYGGAGPRLVNMYGITEATVHVTAREITSGDAERSAVSPIGRPLADTEVFVLDPAGGVVPVGVAGELWVGGAGLARGYLNRPELTAERFVECEIGGRVRRLYRSGDLVRWLSDGELEYLGRLDDQVKVRGFRIELGEIESALVAHPRITAAVVLMREDTPGDRRLVAYVVLIDGTELKTRELREHCLQTLPDYMVPSGFVFLEALPLTVNGKVDRRALPVPDGTRPELGTTFVAPRTPAEEALARIWAGVLGVEQVGVHDNFFELGGDSILSIQVISRAKRYGLHLPGRIIFEYETVAEIAAHATQDAVVSAEQGRVNGDAPLTPVQRWFFELDLATPEHFNQSRLLKTDRLDADALERALESVMEHHDALRLRFDHTASGWTQTHDAGQASDLLERHDLSALPETELWEEFRRRADRLQRAVDPKRGPLLRGALFDLGVEHGQRLLLVVHHLAIDGVSWRILLQDLGDAYRSVAAGERVVLPLKTTSYQEWAARLQQYASTSEALGELGHWTRPRAAAALPRDHAGSNSMSSFGSVTLNLGREETGALLRDVTRIFDARINDVLLTAVAQALHAWTGSDAALIALEGHGREDLFADVDLSRTVGWFTSIFPVALCLEGCQGWSAKVARVREQLATVPNRGIGYGILRYLGSAEVQENLRTLFQPEISFNYLGQFDSSAPGLGRYADDAEPTGRSVDPEGLRAHLIDIIASVQAGSLSLTVNFSKNIHDDVTATTLATNIVSALRDLVQEVHGQAAAGQGQGPEGEAYELTPLQAGILFHSMSDTSAASEVRPYVAQFVDEFAGPLDPVIFRRSWQSVVDRHTILRSAFVTNRDDLPVQAVQPEADLRCDELDWREADSDEQQRLLEQLLADDRSRGFDLAVAPLMRFTLVRTAADRTLVLWSFHHLLLDGWSAQLVQQEFYALYRAAVSGGESGLPAPVPYSRYIGWLRQRSATEAEAFWRQKLAGFETATELGIHQETGRTGFGDYAFELSTELFSKVRGFARSNRLTVNTIVQGIWSLLLSRYSGSEEVLYGTTVSGRPADLPDIERMVGPFINTLPVRVTVAADATVHDWLKLLQDQHAELRQYEYSPLTAIQACSDVPGNQPLFRSILVFENYPKLLGEAELPADLTRKRLLYVERTGYPMVLGVAEAGEALSFHLVYDRGLFDIEAVARMAGHLETLLVSMLEQPDATLRRLRMLTAAELEQFTDWNGNAVAHPDHLTVHELIERQTRNAPEAIAVSFGEYALSYGELNARANQLAHHLRLLGVRPEDMVGVCVERGPDMIVSLLAILKSGGAYVPLDQDFPTERLAFMIKDTGTPVIVTQQHLADRLPADGRTIVCIDADWDEISSRPTVDPAPAAGPENLAYVIYTSGTTGRPKGVMIEHRSMSDRMQEMRRQYRLTSEDKYLQFSSVTFDGSVGEIFPTLIAGAELVLRGEDWNPAWIIETIRTKKVTVCQLPPFVWNELTSQLTSSAELGVQLRLMSMGGERVLPASVERWFQRTSIPLFNIYGPTETTVNMTTCMLTRASAIVPIGAPVANTEVLVVDRHGQQVPIGVPGELWIGGTGVARGYLNRPDLTAERFVRHPFADNPDKRMYRTGDLVRRLPDGSLDILGRMDDQVKLRGFRIELGEVESAVLSHPDIRACVVALRDDALEGKRLVAYCVTALDQRPSVSSLRDWCHRSLPDFMVPSAYVFLEALPSTANGKAVDRKALPEPDGIRPDIATQFVAPRSGAETLIAAIWQEVLGVDHVGAHDNFFELGGDSFLSMQVIAKARKKGIRLTPRIIFQHPTVAELASQVTEGESRAGAARTRDTHTAQPLEGTDSSARFTVVGDVEAHNDGRVAVVALNESSAERTVFCFHEGGGNVSGYVHLAEALAPVARLIGIEARSVAFGAEPEGDVAEMAMSYWGAMRAIQPTGPYLLAGWSFGGALAVEIASLIEKADETVDLLIALDSCLPVAGIARDMIARDHAAVNQLLSLLDEAGETLEEWGTTGNVADLMRWLNLPEAMLALQRSELVKHLRTMEAHTRAVFHYQPPLVRCPVVLYQAQESPWEIPLSESWLPFAGQVDARTVSGGHMSFLRPPNVAVLAKEIAAALADLDD
ncbi:amino acid adenylation domain-containing protein [Streptomyces sioyaensis]|uniref:amino acid adenylation domain-containing protein n=1 Tax=Streptomyces sioyaensis TaxID=67364 RepID=UPI0037CD2DED